MKNIIIIIVIIASMVYMGLILFDKYEDAKAISLKNTKVVPTNSKE